MPRITKDGPSYAADIAPDENPQPVDEPVDDGQSVSLSAVAEAEVVKPKKAAPRKATR